MFYFAAFKIIFLSLYAPITSDGCHAWFHLNAARQAARNTEHVNMTKNHVHGRIQTTHTARPPDYKSTVLTTRQPRLIWNMITDEGSVPEMPIWSIS